MPPAARGALFEKTAPLDPPQKLLIKAVMLCNLKESMQTMTAFGSFKVRRLKRRSKASLPREKLFFNLSIPILLTDAGIIVIILNGARMKKSILIMIAASMLCGPVMMGQSSFTQKDRELLIELRVELKTRMMEIDKRFDQIDKRITELREDTNKRFEELRSDNNNRFDQMMSFIYILAGIFAAMTAATISFALWDRKTMIRPFETKVKEMDNEIAANREATQKIMGFQKDYALKNREYSDVLQRHSLS